LYNFLAAKAFLILFIYYMNRTPSTKKQGKKRETDRQTTECNQHRQSSTSCRH